MGVADGVQCDSKLLSISNDDIFIISKKIGRTLRSIHEHNYIQPSNDNVNFWIEHLNSHKYANNFRNNPGLFSTRTYGDLNFTNIFVDAKNNLTFIDPEYFGRPGPAAYDYYRFFAACKKFGKKKNIILKGFKEGYSDCPFTNECDLFFKTYWNVFES